MFIFKHHGAANIARALAIVGSMRMMFATQLEELENIAAGFGGEKGSVLLEGRNERALEREYQGRRIPTVEFHYEGERIWGATAHMLIELREILKNK